jgi:hypothetical protein
LIHGCNIHIQEAEAGRLRVQVQPGRTTSSGSYYW